MPPAPPLDIKALTVTYPGQDIPAVDGINTTVQPGKITAIIGPNGAGKSTLLKASMGLISPQSGDVSFWGQPLSHKRNCVSYMPQRSAVDWHFPVSVLEVATMGLYSAIGWGRRIKPEHKTKALSCLKAVGMDSLADRPIGALSGGQQQRTFLARALAQNAALYLMDEPFAGIDASTEDIIIEVLKDLKRSGKTIIVVHHNLSTVNDIFDQVIMINKRLIAAGPVATTFSQDNIARTYGVFVNPDAQNTTPAAAT